MDPLVQVFKRELTDHYLNESVVTHRSRTIVIFGNNFLIVNV